MIGNVFEYLANPSLGLYWPRPQNFVSAFVNINVCPPLFLAKCSQNRQTKIELDPPYDLIVLKTCLGPYFVGVACYTHLRFSDP